MLTIARFRYKNQVVGPFDEVFEVECDHEYCRSVYATGCVKKAKAEALEIFGIDNDSLIICGVSPTCTVQKCYYNTIKHFHCKKCNRFSGFELDLCWDHRGKQNKI